MSGLAANISSAIPASNPFNNENVITLPLLLRVTARKNRSSHQGAKSSSHSESQHGFREDHRSLLRERE